MTAIGTGLLAGRYRLEQRIATGGMGEVWRAVDAVLDRPVAVKALKAEHVDDEEFRARFRAEARHAAGLSHPGIASVYDYGEADAPDGRSAWLVMELVDGSPLSDLLRRGPLDVPTALDVVGQTGLALAAAHEHGVVHRDVKPGNLMVRPDGVVKVTDFGIAHAAGQLPLTQTGTVVGTAYYLSPEQALGRSVTPASDVYALGVVAYECLTGRRPFPGDHPVAVASAHLRQPPPPLPDAVPEPVRDLVLRMLAKDPDERPGDAAAVGRTALALREALLEGRDPAQVARLAGPSPAALPLPAPGAQTAHLPAARGRRHHGRALALALAMLLVVALALTGRAVLRTPTVGVPAVAAGADVSASLALLQDAGLRVDQRPVPSADVPAGQALGTDPAAGTGVPEGTVVALLVSTGPPPVVVRGADHVGRTAAQVRGALRAAGLVPLVAYDGSGRAEGRVSGLEPTGELERGSRVVVHVVPDAGEPVVAAPAATAPTSGGATVVPGSTGPAAPAPRPTPESSGPAAPVRTTQPDPGSGKERGGKAAAAKDTGTGPGAGRGRGGGKKR